MRLLWLAESYDRSGSVTFGAMTRYGFREILLNSDARMTPSKEADCRDEDHRLHQHPLKNASPVLALRRLFPAHERPRKRDNMRFRIILADRRLRGQLSLYDLSQRDVRSEHPRRHDDQRPMAQG
jgi:hypothetical protein